MSTIRSSTQLRRASASVWSDTIGSYAEGAWTSPASVADSWRFSSEGCFEKYTCAAAKIPYALCPKYAWFR
nr:hypothetical protein [Glycomyces terrestris]